jgi:hypothetical protein
VAVANADVWSEVSGGYTPGVVQDNEQFAFRDSTGCWIGALNVNESYFIVHATMSISENTEAWLH